MFLRLIYLVLVEFLYIKANAATSDAEILNHVHLSAEVKNFFRASSVFNVYNDKIPDMAILPKMLHLSRCFSDNNILVQSMKMSNVLRYLKYYKYRTLLPLYVVTLKTQQDVDEFSKFARNFEMSLNLWLVFVYKNEQLLKYCEKPDRNLFNVRFDTKMLVKCDNDPMVREWYAVNDQVKVNDLAIWSMKDGLVKVTKKTLWERRSLDGVKLRIATVKESAFATTELERQKGTLYGLFGGVLQELTEILNFTVELVSVEDMYGSFQPENGSWSGVMGRLVANEIDIGVAEFGRSKDRLEVVDFTVPLLLTRMNLYFRQSNMSAIVWSTYAQVFDTRIWMYTFLMVLVSSVLISLMVAKIEGKKVCSALSDNWLLIYGTQCQMGLPKFPSASSLRIAFTSMMIASMVIYTSYSATLTSYLAVFTPSLPFSSEQEFVRDRSYNLTVIRGSVYHDMVERGTDTLSKKMRKRLKSENDLPYSMIEAIDQVCNEKVVLCTNEMFVDKMSDRVPCPLVAISMGRLDSAAFTLTKRSQFRGILNFYIENFRSYGLIKVLNTRHLRKIDPTKTIYSPVSFWSVVPILTIFFIGVGLAALIWLCEGIHYRYCRWRNKHRVQMKFGKC